MRSLKTLRAQLHVSNVVSKTPPDIFERVRVGSDTIAFTVQQRARRRKTVSIVVGSSGVEVRAPAGATLEALRELVRQRAGRIRAQQRQLERLQHQTDPPKNFVSGECVRLMGRQFILKRVRGLPAGVTINGRSLELRADTDAQAVAALEAWYRQQALERGKARAAFWARRFGVPEPSVLIRDQAGRWGSCNTKGELRLNWRIVMAPQSLFNYVIAHEVCHLRVPNHSSEFWACLRQVMPDFARRRDRLALEGRLYSLELNTE